MGPWGVFEPVLDFVVEHRKVCAVLMENQEASRFTEHLQTLIRAMAGRSSGRGFRSIRRRRSPTFSSLRPAA